VQIGFVERASDTRSVMESRIRDKFTTAQPVTNIHVYHSAHNIPLLVHEINLVNNSQHFYLRFLRILSSRSNLDAPRRVSSGTPNKIIFPF
jgi:hypothetical protein